MKDNQRCFTPRQTTRLALALALVFAFALPGCGDDSDGSPEPEAPSDDRRGGNGTSDGDATGGTDGGDNPDAGDHVCDPRSCEEFERLGIPPTDTDGDGIPDCIEGMDDADGDGVPNCLDWDSDGDGIPDLYEGYEDTDGDGIPNFLDLDSDGDGWPDAEEYGRRPGDMAPPIDRDGDGIPDFLDLDSDGDGIPDEEELGCPGSTERTLWDSDGDGISDLVEITFGSDPCDPESDLTGLVDFYFVLPYEGPGDSDQLLFSTDVRQGDIAINIDTTGSMGGSINALRTSLSGSIIPALEERLENAAYSVSHFEDFPCGGYGASNDRPFILLQRVTRDVTAAQAAVDRLPLNNGADIPESGVEALYQIATGAGTNDCISGAVPPFEPLQNLVAGTAEGIIGGVGFRRGSVPIIVHITDAPTHARGESGYPYGATRAEMLEAMNEIGGRVIGVATGGGRPDLEQFATATSAAVPPCAWDTPEGRPAGCAAGQCCTEINGGGRAPVGGLCPLVYDIRSDGRGLDTSIVAGIEALIQFAPVLITAQARPDPVELAESGIDTSCFIQRVVPDVALPRPGACSTDPIPVDTTGDGVLDGFDNTTPGSSVYFDVQAFNDCVPPRRVPQTFFAYIDVVAGGRAVLDTRIVTIVVPPDLKL